MSKPFTDAVCYSNGVATLTSIDINTMQFTLTVSKSGNTCFSFAGDASNPSDLTVKDGSGKTIATLTSNADNTTTVTCDGQSYTLDSSCDPTSDPSMMMGGSSDTCTMGTCTP